MQFPKEYIKQCREAGEVQGLWVPREGDWILNISAVPEPFLFVNHRHQPDEDSAKWELLVQGKTDHLLWLPLQHQLWELLPKTSSPFYHIAGLRVFISKDYKDKKGPCYYFSTMEQLLLAYVMFEKFNKKWDGSCWK